MCPVASLVQQFLKRRLDHRKQPGLRALPKEYLLLPLLATKQLAKMGCWSDPERRSYFPVLRERNHRDSAVTLYADVFPTRYPLVISFRLLNIIQSGLTTSLDIRYYPRKRGFSFFQINLSQLAAVDSFYLLSGLRLQKTPA